MRGVRPFIMGFWAPINLIRFETKTPQLLGQQILYVNSFLYINICFFFWSEKKTLHKFLHQPPNLRVSKKNWYRKKYRFRYRKNLVAEKSFGFGFVQILGDKTSQFWNFSICLWFQILYRKNLVSKNVSDLVLKKFGIGYGIRQILYRKQVLNLVLFRFWVSSHTDRHG